MDKLFDTVLELSWQAGLIALAVMLVRLALRRCVSRRAVCWLWVLVALRLVLPMSLTAESPVSLQAEESPVSRAFHAMETVPAAAESPTPTAPGEAQPSETKPAAAEAAPQMVARWLPWVWVIGMGCMAAYMLLSFVWMWLKLLRAEHIEGNAYRCTEWSTPFVLGIISPRIYVPENVSEQDFPQVLAHERCHIRRWDHVVKPLAFLLLAVNWFNPVLWAAYVLLGRDMESACDEMVLKNATPAQRAAYSRVLVACAAQPKLAAVCPLAFGEVAVKERVKNVLQNRKQAVWAVVLLAAAAVIIAVCLLTKPAEKNTGIPDAETLYALRTEYIGDNAAVSGILDALGFREAGAAGEDEWFAYSFEIIMEEGSYGVAVHYGHTALPQRTAEWNRQMAQRGYLALALIDNAEWLRWEDSGAEGESVVSGTVYVGDYVLYDYNAVRGSVAGLQTLMDTLQARTEDGSIVYHPSDALPDFTEITTWSMLGEDGVVSAKAEDYGIVYDTAQLPDWEAVPLSYLCAYYLNADGAYAEGAMDTLAKRYVQAPHTVRDYLELLRGVDADAAGRLEREIPAWCEAMGYGGDTTTAGEYAAEPYTVEYEGTDLKLRITDVYAQSSVTVRYDENLSEEQPVYTVGSNAQLTVIKGEGFTLYGRYRSENIPVHNGEVIDLLQAYTGIGMDGLYNVQFRYIDRTEAAQADQTAAQLEVYSIQWETGDSAKQVVPLTEAQVQAIRSEKGLVQPEWHTVYAELQQKGEAAVSYMGTDYKPVPPTVLKILTEQCGYTFVTPEDFRGNMTSAKLEFYNGETYTADKADLPALQKMLTNAKSYGGASACVFTAKLTVTFDDGRTVSVLKGTDSCPSFTFGSWNSAMISQAENEQFWQIFGVPFDG